ncbi:MAG: hypothetical protein ACFCVK_07710 [Acidimicrobiales bacterium]
MNERPLAGAVLAGGIVLALSLLLLDDVGLGRLHAPLTVSALCFGATTWARPLTRTALVFGGGLVVAAAVAAAAGLADVAVPGWMVAAAAAVITGVAGAARLARSRS